MFNNFKNILIGVLATILVIAIGASVYNVFASPDTRASATTLNTSNQNGNGNGNGNGGSQNPNGGQAGQVGIGTPQANITDVTTIHGTVVSFDLTGISITTDAGQAQYVQLGNSRYSQSIGFAPQAGEGVTVVMFPGDQGLYNAISVTIDSTGTVYTFRSESGQPMWAGAGGNGNGGNGNRR